MNKDFFTSLVPSFILISIYYRPNLPETEMEEEEQEVENSTMQMEEQLLENKNISPTISLEKLSEEAIMPAEDRRNINERYIIKCDI